jgi:hypothetical protein
MDSPCSVKFFANCALDLRSRAGYQTRQRVLRTKFRNRRNPRDNSRNLANLTESSGSETSRKDASGPLHVDGHHGVAHDVSLEATRATTEGNRGCAENGQPGCMIGNVKSKRW